MSDTGAAQTPPIERLTRHVMYVAEMYMLFVELRRNHAFAEAITGTPAAHGANLLADSLARDLVVQIRVMFDTNKDSADMIRETDRVLAASPERSGADLDRLRAARRRLDQCRYTMALDRLRRYRNEAIAHLDLRPGRPSAQPYVRDFGVVLAAAYRLIAELNRVVHRDKVLGLGSCQMMRHRTARFAEALAIGALAQTASQE